MDLSKSISIIVPTHNRHKYLERCVKFYAENLAEISLQICDSSKEPHPNLLQRRGNEYNEAVRLVYHHCPQFSFVEKVNFALQNVTSPYVMLMADDDFFSLNGIKKSVEFLEQNPLYSTAQGTYTRFTEIKNELVLFPIYEVGLKNELENEDKNIRLQKLMQHYYPLFYAVQRTEVMQTTYTEMVKNKINIPTLVEFITSVFPLCFGKIKMLPEFYSAREHISTSEGAVAISFPTIKQSEKMKTQYEAFLKLVHQFVSPEKEFSKVETEKIFEPYLQKGYTSNKKKIAKLIRKILPKAIEQKIIAAQQAKNIFSKIIEYSQHQGFPFGNEKFKAEWEQMKKYILAK